MKPSIRIRKIMHEMKNEFDLGEEVFHAHNPGAAFGQIFNYSGARIEAIMQYLDEQYEKSKEGA